LYEKSVRDKENPMRTKAYRYPHEHLILIITLSLVFAAIALTVTATVCTSLIFILGFLSLSFYLTWSHHQSLINTAMLISQQENPTLSQLVKVGSAKLNPGKIKVYITRSRSLNAYTFGLSSPKVIVLYSSLFQVMDSDELLFILGHEMGHIALGHTWLNSLVGGMAGIPSPYAVAAILSLAFLWWNRACEYSADRAGLLACSNPHKAISALIKLEVGLGARTQQDMERAFKRIDAEDDTILNNLSETLGTHPMLIKRINQIRRYAASSQYKRLSSQLS
jgi:Zn-dependent protease with chaperone function